MTTTTTDTATVRVLAAAVTVAGLAHVPPTGHHLAEAPYVGAGFVLFTLACLAVLLGLTARPGRALLSAVVALCGGAVAAYVATRLVPFPGLAHDVGAWRDPFGTLSVAAELVATGAALRLLRTQPLLAVAP